MAAYYNEIDPFAAQWLRNLIVAGHIAPGEVDERSIIDVEPSDLKGFTQCHFFAGVGVWSYALRRSMWPDERPVWTGSCPCQPFSAAGNQKGIEDERHLWPAWFELVSECQPAVVFGEQVASSEVVGKADGSGENVWIDVVQADMERASYAFASFDLPAAGFGAPHARQREYFAANRVGDSQREGLEGHPGNGDRGHQPGRIDTNSIRPVTQAGSTSGLAHNKKEQRHGRGPSNEKNRKITTNDCADGSVANGNGGNASTERKQPGGQHGQQQTNTSISHGSETACPVNGFWRGADWLGCRDGKFRPVEPGTFPLAHGATQRVGRLRAYGNAICAEVATGFISAYLDQ